MQYGIYETDTGKLLTIGTCPNFAFESQRPSDSDLGLIQLPEQSWDYYVDITTNPHEAKPKNELSLTVSATQIMADGVDTTTITNIPNPTEVTWPDGETTTVTDGEIVFGVDLVGTHYFTFESLAHLKRTIEIEAI